MSGEGAWAASATIIRMSEYRQVYPFTALVGQDRMRLALELNAVNPAIGGVLIRGEKGTAKSTAVRALARLLPELKVVRGCHYSCDPDSDHLCQDCRGRLEKGEERLPWEMRRMRVVELPINASEDRVVGSIDLEAAIKSGERRFEPGVLAEANRQILYVDEVNLLDDHIVDVLLDAAAMGVNVVEREGISFSHPARFILVGTMNPEEGELRPQLLDRFALSVDIVGIRDARERVIIMERNLSFERDAEAFRKEWKQKEDELSNQIDLGRKLVDQVTYTSRDLLSIAALTASLNVDGHRADLVILKAARAQAAFEGRTRITDHDIALAAELALPHRIKRTPFQQAEITSDQLQERIEQLAGQSVPSEAEDDSESEKGKPEEKKT